MAAEIARLLPPVATAHVVGITGSPGVGKSTTTAALIAEWRDRGLTVAVVAVDPSSPFTGGALLGDRVRMESHSTDDGVYIRSMAARGQLGGLSAATPAAERQSARLVITAMGGALSRRPVKPVADARNSSFDLRPTGPPMRRRAAQRFRLLVFCHQTYVS